MTAIRRAVAWDHCPLPYYRTNVYSSMSDTPKMAENSAETRTSGGSAGPGSHLREDAPPLVRNNEFDLPVCGLLPLSYRRFSGTSNVSQTARQITLASTPSARARSMVRPPSLSNT